MLPLTRVTQLDASLLDDELLTTLMNQIPFKTHTLELKLLLKTLLFKLTVWDRSQSYGLFLQNLKYKQFTTVKKLLYYTIFIFGGYITSKYESFLYRDSNKPFLKAYKLFNLVNYLQFLVTGDYQSLKYRLLNLKLMIFNEEQAKSKGNVSFEFQNRQLIWNTMLEFILFIMPILSKNNHLFQKVTPQQLIKKDADLCGICLNKLVNPYKTSCGHCYCYVCVVGKLERAKGQNPWECVECGEAVDSVIPFDDIDPDCIEFELEKDDDEEDEDDNELNEKEALRTEDDQDNYVDADEYEDSDEGETDNIEDSSSSDYENISEDDELIEEDFDQF